MPRIETDARTIVFTPLDAARAHLADLVHRADRRHAEGWVLEQAELQALADACAELLGSNSPNESRRSNRRARGQTP